MEVEMEIDFLKTCSDVFWKVLVTFSNTYTCVNTAALRDCPPFAQCQFFHKTRSQLFLPTRIAFMLDSSGSMSRKIPFLCYLLSPVSWHNINLFPEYLPSPEILPLTHRLVISKYQKYIIQQLGQGRDLEDGNLYIILQSHLFFELLLHLQSPSYVCIAEYPFPFKEQAVYKTDFGCQL